MGTFVFSIVEVSFSHMGVVSLDCLFCRYGKLFSLVEFQDYLHERTGSSDVVSIVSLRMFSKLRKNDRRFH